MIQRLLTLTLILILSTPIFSQTRRGKEVQPVKKAMTIEDVVKWNRITQKELSGDGSLIAVKLEPWKGSSKMRLYNNKGVELFSADSASSLSFDHSSEYLLFTKGESKKQSLVIYSVKNKESRTIDKVKSFVQPEGWEGFVIYHKSDSTLFVENISGSISIPAGKITSYKTSEEGNKLLVTNGKNVLIQALHKERADTVWKGGSSVSSIALSKNGEKAAIVTNGKLLVWTPDKSIKEIASNVSDKREPFFSPDGSRLYYGLNPVAKVRDTTIKKEDFPVVQVWHWKEGRQFTQQVVDKKQDLNMSYLAVYTFEKDGSYTITNDYISETKLILKGNSAQIAGLSQERYLLEQMWTGRPKYDLFVINTFLERNALIKEGIDGDVRVSPAGKYLYWYSAPDSAWFTCSLLTFEVKKITDSGAIKVYDQENDVPDWPSSYSISGWSMDDKYILINDRYDIWRVDPESKEAPVNITGDGSERKITYRIVQEKTDDPVNLSAEILLSAFNNIDKSSAYCLLKPGVNSKPAVLYSGSISLSDPVKAKKSESYIFTRESFTEFPDIWYTDTRFKKVVKITDANPQKKEFIWGSAELVKWISFDGKELEGVVYKPDNFDPSKKYPLIVNFYEKNSSTLYSHRIPEAHRSTVDYHLYNSNGYIIFNPDIVYKEGYPGESAFNAVMPGINALIEKGYVDPARIGAQGHSWGGYQVAYLATRTTLFAAIESGAPVVNMFSAYGGIRWGTGLNRSFQYEHQQSRIGKTPWESPLRYIENSPLFTMDKVTTPILIMHNDQDGHVPWWQGIEFFVALKRLQKPAWLLNYTGEVHWPQKLNNKVDFQKRMMQFFNHYLKGEPMPEWMSKGISAIDLDYRTGY